MTRRNVLLRLLREALWGEPFEETITAKEAVRLVALARKHTVAGLIVDLLIKRRIRMEKHALLESWALMESIKLQNQNLDTEVAEFAKTMREAKMEYIMVKGQTIAALYPHPELRNSGDIDFLVTDYGKAANALKQCWDIELPPSIVEKEAGFEHNGFSYELHTYLVDFGARRHQRYWEKALAESEPWFITIEGEEVRVMHPTLCAVYLFLHIFYHFIHEGIGLRHLCDWAVMMHYYADTIEKDRLTEILKGIGLLKAFRAFGTILVDHLGMKDFPLTLEEGDRRLQRTLLRDIMEGGNFGKSNRRVKEAGLLYKGETLWVTLRNIFRYLPLAPSELIMLTNSRLRVNLRVIRHRLSQRGKGKNNVHLQGKSIAN